MHGYFLHLFLRQMQMWSQHFLFFLSELAPGGMAAIGHSEDMYTGFKIADMGFKVPCTQKYHGDCRTSATPG